MLPLLEILAKVFHVLIFPCADPLGQYLKSTCISSPKIVVSLKVIGFDFFFFLVFIFKFHQLLHQSNTLKNIINKTFLGRNPEGIWSET